MFRLAPCESGAARSAEREAPDEERTRLRAFLTPLHECRTLLCPFREALQGDATLLWKKREALPLGRAASASQREAGTLFPLRLSGERATTPGKRERREVYGAAALGERTQDLAQGAILRLIALIGGPSPCVSALES